MIKNQDGVTFINIYSKGFTPIGRKLSNLYVSKPFQWNGIPVSTIEALWYWTKLSTKISVEDLVTLRRIFTLNGFEAKKLGQQIQRKYDWTDAPDYMTEEFKTVIIEAIKLKINSDKELKQEFVFSVLPFKHYYVSHMGEHHLPEFDWMIKAISDYRYELQVQYILHLKALYGHRVFTTSNAPKGALYIGRGKGGSQTIYGNPNVLRNTKNDRERVSNLITYRNIVFQTVSKTHLLQLENKDVICFCNNSGNEPCIGDACHGLVLLSAQNTVSKSLNKE